jgi:uncharacterized protein YcaQ
VETVSVAQLRRYAVAHQGYTTRFRRARAADIAATVHRLGCVQLDSISTVGRAHRLTLSARIGHYPEAAVSRLLREGRIFEYWAHEACLVPIEDYPLFKRRMVHLSEQHWWGRKHDHDPKVREAVLGALREHGPRCRPGFFEGGAAVRGMWNWKPENAAARGLCSRPARSSSQGRDGFQRLYDLPERVIPRLGARRAGDLPRTEFRRGYARRCGARAAVRSPSPGSPSTAGSRAGIKAMAPGRRSPRRGGARPAGRGRRRRGRRWSCPPDAVVGRAPSGGVRSLPRRQPRLGSRVPAARLSASTT